MASLSVLVSTATQWSLHSQSFRAYGPGRPFQVSSSRTHPDDDDNNTMDHPVSFSQSIFVFYVCRNLGCKIVTARQPPRQVRGKDGQDSLAVCGAELPQQARGVVLAPAVVHRPRQESVPGTYVRPERGLFCSTLSSVYCGLEGGNFFSDR